MNYELLQKLDIAGFPLKKWTEHEYEDVWAMGQWKADCKLCGHRNTSYAKVFKGDLETYSHDIHDCPKAQTRYEEPSLEQLIEMCGGSFGVLFVGPGIGLWTAKGNGIEVHSPTKEEAVANLYLALHKRSE